MKEKLKNKEELIAAARVAEGSMTPEAAQFWDELKERMDIREKSLNSLVEPRKLRD